MLLPPFQMAVGNWEARHFHNLTRWVGLGWLVEGDRPFTRGPRGTGQERLVGLG